MFDARIEPEFGVQTGPLVKRFRDRPAFDRRFAEEREDQLFVLFLVGIAENDRIVVVLVTEKNKKRDPA